MRQQSKGKGLHLSPGEPGPRCFAIVVWMLALAVLWAAPIWAEDNVWQSNGPWGGDVLVLAVDPSTSSTLYAGTSGGIFKSTDAGASWFRTNLISLQSPYIHSLAIDPKNTTTLYAGTSYGIFKSIDGGISWWPSSNGLAYPFVMALAIDPSLPSTVYAATENPYAFAVGMVYKSSDAGAMWVAANLPLSDYLSLAIDPVNPSVVYAGDFGGGLYKSIDRGESWSRTGFPYGVALQTVVISPSIPSTLYVGAYDAGVYVSNDGGASWTTAGLEGADVRILVVDPFSPTVLYAGTEAVTPRTGNYQGGVFRSSDGGTNWVAMSNGLADRHALAMAADPLIPATLYSGFLAGGVFKSFDGGAHWTASNKGLVATHISAMALDPLTPSTLYAGTYFDGGLFKSTDGGLTWAAINEGLLCTNIVSLAVDPCNPQILYAGTRQSDGIFTSANWSDLFKSTDGGEHWVAAAEGIPVDNRNIESIVIDPSNPSTVYAAAEGDVYKSTDGGAHWTATSCPSWAVKALAIDPDRPSAIYTADCGGSGGIFKSTDGGASWAVSGNSPSYCFVALAINPLRTQIIYAASLYYGIFKSTDDGTTWKPCNTGLDSSYVQALAIDPLDPEVLYAGTYNGVARTLSGGASWWPPVETTGLVNRDIYTLAVDPINPRKLYAGTWGSGVFSYTTAVSPPPVIGNIHKGASPFQLVVVGSNLQSGVRLYINGAWWPDLVWKNTEKMKIVGGARLKERLPKGAPALFRFVNPDGGVASLAWSR